MSAYTKSTVAEFIRSSPSELVGLLQQAYAADGFCSQYTRQTIAWARVIPDLQRSLRALVAARPETSEWFILLEYPLYRLRRRIDLVILAGSSILVVECKVGAEDTAAENARQVGICARPPRLPRSKSRPSDSSNTLEHRGQTR